MLALAAIASLLLPWTRYCVPVEGCFTNPLWGTSLGIACAAVAAALLVCELLPVLRLGRERAFLGAVLAFALAAVLGLAVGFELGGVFIKGSNETNSYGLWVAMALAVLLALAGAARLRDHLWDVPLMRPGAEWRDALVLGGAVLAFGSTLLTWLTPTNVPPTTETLPLLTSSTVTALFFGLSALALAGCELLRLAGVRPARLETLVPASIVLGGLTALFGVVAVVETERELTKYASFASGAWVGLAAAAAVALGVAVRLREIDRADV